MVATKRLGIGSKIKVAGKQVTRTVTGIDVDRSGERAEVVGVNLDDGSTISRKEIEFAIDAEK